MNITEARGIAGQIWCEPEHAHREMDAELGESIARQILQAYQRGVKDMYGDVVETLEAIERRRQ